MVGLEIKATGFEDISRALAALLAKGDDLGPLLDEIGAALVDSSIERFETSTDHDGDQWIVSGRAAREGGKTLVDQGHLRDSITHVVTGDSVTRGTNVVYAAIQHFGGTIKAKNAPYLKFATPKGFAQVKEVTLPARPFLGLSDDDETVIGEITAAWLMEAAQ